MDRCITWNDTSNVWTIDQVTASSFNVIMTSSGTSALTSGAILTGTGDPGRVAASALTLASSLPTTFGDFAVRAYNSGALSFTSGTAAVVTLDSERWDTDTMHSTSSSTSRLTATTAGRYQMTGHVEFDTSVARGQRLVEILLNGATVIAAEYCQDNPDGSRPVPCTIAAHYALIATDYVELRITQRAQTTLNINASSNYSPEFEMVKVP